MLYSYKGAYPQKLPNRIRLSDGTTRTDKESFTSDEIADAGWFEVPDPPIVQYPNKLEWNGSSWEVRAPNDAEKSLQWQKIRDKRNKILSSYDGQIMKELEQGLSPNTQIVEYKQMLRDIPQTQTDPFNIRWPLFPKPQANT